MRQGSESRNELIQALPNSPTIFSGTRSSPAQPSPAEQHPTNRMGTDGRTAGPERNGKLGGGILPQRTGSPTMQKHVQYG